MVSNRTATLPALGLMVLGVAVVLALSMSRTDGVFTYPLDDAYIHLAVARSLATSGVWGVTTEAFSSSTSSISWPLLLAACLLTSGTWSGWALVLNLLFAAGAILVLDGWLRDSEVQARARVWLLIGFVALVPLWETVALGMEHSLHVFAMLLLLRCVHCALGGTGVSAARVAAYAAFAAAARYETLLFLAPVVLAFCLARKPRAAIAAAVGGAAPAVVFGVTSLVLGWEFLPNPINAKRVGASGAGFDLADYALRFSLNAAGAPVLVAATVVVFALALHHWRRGPSTQPAAWLGLCVAALGLGHLLTGGGGSLGRYEAYLVALDFAVLALLLRGVIPSSQTNIGWGVAIAAGGTVCVALLGAQRVVGYLPLLPDASRNIFDQQMQMARVVRALPSPMRVAINDIGAVSLLGEHRIFDVWDLASLPRARFHQELQRAGSTRNLAHSQGATVAAVYAHAFPESPEDTPRWQEVGSFDIANNVICADPRVHFLAADGESAHALRAALVQVFATLPERTRSRIRPPEASN